MDRNTYLRSRKEACHEVYFDTSEEREQYRALAKAAGYRNFSQWIIQMLVNATSGNLYPEGHVQALQKEVEKLREREKVKDEQIKEQHDEIRNLMRQVADLSGVSLALAREGTPRAELAAPARRAKP